MVCKSVTFTLFMFGSSLSLTGNALGGVAFFRETCVASMNDFGALETRVPALGMTKINDMPSRVLPNPKSVRTWTSHTFPGNPGDGWVQIALGSDAQPFEVCSHMSRPGESATEALAALQRLYPPVEGSTKRETDSFYGGRETWAAHIEGIEVFLRVVWSFLNQPSSGSSELILIKPRAVKATTPSEAPPTAGSEIDSLAPGWALSDILPPTATPEQEIGGFETSEGQPATPSFRAHLSMGTGIGQPAEGHHRRLS
jgi:hypothetical protein